MKKYGLLMLLAASFGVFAQPNNMAVLQKSLKPWQPLSINEHGGAITLTLNEDRVTTEIYEAVIAGGVCAPSWLETKKTGYLKNAKEVRVLNRNNSAGFVFENPKSSCDEVGKAKGDDGKLVISSHTHSY